MARVNDNGYPEMKWDALNHPVVIVVDMINGFVKEGALADPAIEKIGPEIAEVLEKTQAPSLFITDAHQPGCMEFESFPPHCLEGTEESQVMDLLKPYAKNVLKKNSINTFSAPGFIEWYHHLKKPCDLIITGCCTDLCVLQLVLSLISYIHEHDQKGMRVIVPVSCVDTYDMNGVHSAVETNRFALENMAANGVTVISRFIQ